MCWIRGSQNQSKDVEQSSGDFQGAPRRNCSWFYFCSTFLHTRNLRDVFQYLIIHGIYDVGFFLKLHQKYSFMVLYSFSCILFRCLRLISVISLHRCTSFCALFPLLLNYMHNLIRFLYLSANSLEKYNCRYIFSPLFWFFFLVLLSKQTVQLRMQFSSSGTVCHIVTSRPTLKPKTTSRYLALLFRVGAAMKKCKT